MRSRPRRSEPTTTGRATVSPTLRLISSNSATSIAMPTTPVAEIAQDFDEDAEVDGDADFGVVRPLSSSDEANADWALFT